MAGATATKAKDELVAWLIAERGRRGEVRHRAAIGAGVTPTSLWRAEHGHSIPSAGTLRKLCKHYGADFDHAHELMLAALAERSRNRERGR